MTIVVYGLALVLLLVIGAWRERDRKAADREQRRRRTTAKQRRYQASHLADIDHMTGRDFEYYVCHLLVHRGFVATVTPASNDFGVDIIAHRNGQKYAIQVKRYHNGVSRRAVSDAVTGKQHYGCDRAMVITNSFFTEGAKELARSTGCELVDRNLLTQWICEYQQATAAAKVPVVVPDTSDHDESLEVGLAAGMDIPTAMVVSSRQNRLPSANTGCSLVLVYIILVELLAMFIVGLLH
jgi:restriction system protein